MLWIPLNNLANTQSLDVKTVCDVGILGSIYRNQRNNAFVKERHCHVLAKSTSFLVNVGFDRQAVVETTVNLFNKSTVIVQAHMQNWIGGDVHTEAGIDGRDD
jgi:hypothetical protein